MDAALVGQRPSKVSGLLYGLHFDGLRYLHCGSPKSFSGTTQSNDVSRYPGDTVAELKVNALADEFFH
jgi:hypothetical protein